jgi:long-chain acyl-CoA synthetase
VRGVPIKVFESALPSMRTVWELARGYGDRDYVVYEDERYTYAESDAIIRALAARLVDEYGVQPGDRVALAMRNYPEWVFGYWAIVSIGAAVRRHERVVDHRGDAVRPVRLEAEGADRRRRARRAGVAGARRAARRCAAARDDRALRRRAARRRRPLGGRDRSGIGARRAARVDIDPDDDACIFYTSGTTGFPKGAQLTHRGSVHNLLNIVFMTTVAGLAAAKAGATPPDPGRGADGSRQNVFMAPTPLFHVTANNCLLHPATIAGGGSCSPTSGMPGERSS